MPIGEVDLPGPIILDFSAARNESVSFEKRHTPAGAAIGRFHPSHPTYGIATCPLSAEIWRYPTIYLDRRRSDSRLHFYRPAPISARVEQPEIGLDT